MAETKRCLIAAFCGLLLGSGLALGDDYENAHLPSFIARALPGSTP